MTRSEFNRIRDVVMPNVLDELLRAEDPASERRLDREYKELRRSIAPYLDGREALEEDAPVPASPAPRVAYRVVPLTGEGPIRLGRRSGVLPFLSGFAACYLLASACLSAVAYASQPMTLRDAAIIGPRWPLTLRVLLHPEEWRRDRLGAPEAAAE